MHLKTAMRLPNDTIMAFDEDGEQIPGLQGHYEDVHAGIMCSYGSGTVFLRWNSGEPEPRKVPRNNW